jgi:hypothetical protein
LQDRRYWGDEAKIRIRKESAEVNPFMLQSISANRR